VRKSRRLQLQLEVRKLLEELQRCALQLEGAQIWSSTIVVGISLVHFSWRKGTLSLYGYCVVATTIVARVYLLVGLPELF
jgi:hypothetical protein